MTVPARRPAPPPSVRPSLSPRSEALAFRIWQLCQPIGWDCTAAHCAEALDESVGRVRRVAQAKGWTQRFRSVVQERSGVDLRDAVDAPEAARLAGVDLAGIAAE